MPRLVEGALWPMVQSTYGSGLDHDYLLSELRDRAAVDAESYRSPMGL